MSKIHLLVVTIRVDISSETSIRQTKSRNRQVVYLSSKSAIQSNIYRANSNQSLRIRNLESEVSRLLSENVSLREQIIKLHYELEKSASRSTLDSVNDVKIKLETKLAELGNLVYELGAVQKTGENSRPQKRKSMTRSSPKRSPDQRNWRNTLTLSEATGGADGRLPPIVEDKCFPRRTLESVLVRQLLFCRG